MQGPHFDIPFAPLAGRCPLLHNTLPNTTEDDYRSTSVGKALYVVVPRQPHQARPLPPGRAPLVWPRSASGVVQPAGHVQPGHNTPLVGAQRAGAAAAVPGGRNDAECGWGGRGGRGEHGARAQMHEWGVYGRPGATTPCPVAFFTRLLFILACWKRAGRLCMKHIYGRSTARSPRARNGRPAYVHLAWISVANH